MKIGIVVIHWRDADQTRKTLKHLLSWKEIEMTLVLVQNEHSIDAFPDIVSPSILKIVSAENLGFGGANNRGFDALKNEDLAHVLLLNADAHIEESEVIKLLKHAQSNKQLFSCGPMIIEQSGDKMIQYVGGLDISKHIITRQTYSTNLDKISSINVDYNIGAVILINTGLFEQLGGFDSDYFFSGEMADLCFRAQVKGLQCQTLLAAKGYHYSASTKTRDTLYKYYSLRNRLLFINKHNLGFKHKWVWYKLAIKELLYQSFKLNGKQVKVMGLSLLHMIMGVTGNQNKHFA